METGEKIIEAASRNSKGEVKNRLLELGKDVKFDTDILETFALSECKSIVYDAMVVAAAVECADRGCQRPVGRPSYGWARELYVTIPVCNIDRWMSPDVIKGLREAIEFLTGDRWHVSFRKLKEPETLRRNLFLNMEIPVNAVIAFSEGMDSHTVAGIIDPEEKKLVRVRMKPQKPARGKKEVCVAVPYLIKTDRVEDSARSRGFKFAMIGAAAAYMTKTEKIIVPESGQEVVGSALLPVGHKYPDYRTSPLFAKRMDFFLKVLFERPFRFEFPRIWHTKGETLRDFVDSAEELRKDSWKETRSCWRTSQWVSVEGERRQCGVCAACMLRRMSVHATGLEESRDAYVCDNMEATTLEAATDPKFPESKLNKAFREYAVAGILHMDHLSALADKKAFRPARRHAMFLGPALGIPREEAEKKMNGLLARHAEEWKKYVKSLGPDSFVGKIARTVK